MKYNKQSSWLVVYYKLISNQIVLLKKVQVVHTIKPLTEKQNLAPANAIDRVADP